MEIITSWENHLQSPRESNTWGSHIDNGCYQGKLLDSKTGKNTKESNQNLFWMQKIPYLTFHYTTTRHSSIRQTHWNKIFSSNWYTFCWCNHVSQQKQKWEKGIHTSFHMQFNKSNSFRITAGSNHRWIHKSIEKINCKKRMSWNNLFKQCKDLRCSF